MHYVTVESTRGGRAINVGVSDKKEGPFKDALNGKHLAGPNWDYIDPTVFIDDDGQAWLYWGNPKLYYCPLKENMIECASDIKVSDMSGFNGKYTEGPWIHKRGKKYYMIYAAGGIPIPRRAPGPTRESLCRVANRVPRSPSTPALSTSRAAVSSSTTTRRT